MFTPTPDCQGREPDRALGPSLLGRAFRASPHRHGGRLGVGPPAPRCVRFSVDVCWTGSRYRRACARVWAAQRRCGGADLCGGPRRRGLDSSVSAPGGSRGDASRLRAGAPRRRDDRAMTLRGPRRRATAVARRLLIVNADDFGLSASVNAGVVQAHDTGIVTSASLMVTMPAAEEAVFLASARPKLSVGIHLDLTGEGGPPPLDLDDVAACERELRHQLNRFGDLMGCLPTHVDAHHNINRTASLAPLFHEFASRYGLPLRESSRVRYFPDFYGQWDDGESHPEWISAKNLMRMLDDEIGAGLTELSCHPGRADPTLRSSYRRERAIELATLCDPAVRRHIEAVGIQLITYHDLPRLLAASEAT